MKTVCSRHDWAHEVEAGCKWCKGMVEDGLKALGIPVRNNAEQTLENTIERWEAIDLPEADRDEDTVPMYRVLVPGRGIQITTPDGSTPIITAADLDASFADVQASLDALDGFDDLSVPFDGFDANGMYID